MTIVDPTHVSVGLALLASLVSFLLPCVLSLVPAYVGYLSSRSLTPEGATVAHRWETVAQGLAFVLGFSVVFIALGAAASAIGALLFDARGLLTRIGGVIVILFGLHMLGLIHIPFLEYDTRRQQAPDRRLGYLSSALMGVFFSAGWAPCVGLVLGAVLTLALTADALGRGVVLLAAYSLGLGIPFLFAAAGVGRVSALLRRYEYAMRYASLATGVFLVLIGVLVFTDSLQALANVTFVSEVQTSRDEGVVQFWRWLTGGGR